MDGEDIVKKSQLIIKCVPARTARDGMRCAARNSENAKRTTRALRSTPRPEPDRVDLMLRDRPRKRRQSTQPRARVEQQAAPVPLALRTRLQRIERGERPVEGCYTDDGVATA